MPNTTVLEKENKVKSLELLKSVFGYDDFRFEQGNVIEHCLNNQDALVIMPTGGGKSLCYQIPALQKKGTCIVVSPLISLMQDQVMALRDQGVNAHYWNSTLTQEDVKALLHDLKKGEVPLLYLAPERLMMDGFDELLSELDLSLFAIDEAHCISEWGHEFRADYRNLKRLRERFPQIPIIALTATATPRVIEDIQKQLQIPEAKLFKSSFDRQNLFYEIQNKQDTFQKILAFIQKRPNESGIIYAQSRKQVESISEKLKAKNINAAAYHAGLDDGERKKNQEKFIHDDIQIMVATVAFGMGINKPDVRFVIHHDLPKTIENYYQETGRAGRDGEASHCLLFFSYADKQKNENFIEQINDKNERLHAKKKLQQLLDFASRLDCRRKQLLRYFDEEYPHSNCQNCDICKNPPQLEDVTLVSQKILSCIYRVKQRFGAQVIIDVLLGRKNPRIDQYQLKKLSVYNIEKDHNDKQLREIIHYLCYINAIHVEGLEYPILTLGPKAKAIFKNEDIIKMPLSKHITLNKNKKNKLKAQIEHKNPDLFERLRQLRSKLAKERQVPPYIIFPDRTLHEMTQKHPKNLFEFKALAGVGEKKARRYGAIFLEALETQEASFKL